LNAESKDDKPGFMRRFLNKAKKLFKDKDEEDDS